MAITFPWPRTRFPRPAPPPHRPLGSATSVLAAAALVAWVGCALPPLETAEQRGDFAAHPGYRGLVVDRMDGGPAAVLVRATSSTASPTHVLEAGGHPIAALWIADHVRIVARQAPDLRAPPIGDVAASWVRGAMQLTFHTADGGSFHTSRFDRVDSDNFPNVLDRETYSVLDLPGVYRAALLDERNVPAGWLRVRILPYQGLPRDYQADVPRSLNGALAVGAVALVDAEIDSIVRQNTLPGDRIPEGIAP